MTTTEIEKKLVELTAKFQAFTEFTKNALVDEYNGNALEEDVVYHLNRMAGFPLLILKENRRTTKRACKMLEGCKKDGITTPAIVVDAVLLSESGLTMIDPMTLQPATVEQILSSYVLLEGHGRLHGWLMGYALDGQIPFDFSFIYRKYNTTEEVMSAYTSTNLFMTRTTNADRLNIAAVRCNDPYVKICTQRIKEEGCIAKAAQIWTYGKEMKPAEVKLYIEQSPDAPKIDPILVEARSQVYEAFKTRFSNPGAEKVYRGVAVAQWTAEKIKDPVTAEELASSICEKVAAIDEGLYTTLITAKGNPKTRQGKNDVMMCALDKMMKR